PAHDPEDEISLDDVADAPTFHKEESLSSRDPNSVFGVTELDTDATVDRFAPFLNATVFRLMNWFYALTTKTLEDLNRLVHNVLRAEDFNLDDLVDFDASREAR
ncbi:hypothetical protein C8J56DRAFT_751518, partial [Mycena floridula]